MLYWCKEGCGGQVVEHLPLYTSEGRVELRFDLKDWRKVRRPWRAGARKGAVDKVYRTGFTAAFKGSTNTATHANTCQEHSYR